MRALRRIAMAFAALAVVAAVPIIWVETACRSVESPQEEGTGRAPAIDDPGYRRSEARSYLSYPEWYIVHAYEDFAGVLAERDEAAFDYLDSIKGFWSSLCGSTRVASRSGEAGLDIKAMLYIIGLSFTAEMAIKGLYEETVGRLTAWLRGAERTAEDRFALRHWQDYARFLRQTPWYEYPFGAELARFWRETPMTGADIIRKAERRIGLSIEYGLKAGYAAVLRQMAGLAPAELRIKTVVRGLDGSDVEAEPRIAVLRELGDNMSLIETPRYRSFTEILRGFASRGRQVIEIAGNDDILVTALVPEGVSLPAGLAEEIFALPIQSRPGWRRLGLDVRVARLTDLILALDDQGAEFEHAYDY